MAKKLLPSDYFGSYSTTGTTPNFSMVIDPAGLVSGGLTGLEVVESAALTITTSTTPLTIGLTYTVLSLGSLNAADWNIIGWNGTSVPAVGDTFTALTTGQVTSGTNATVKSGDIRRILLGIVEAAYQKYLTYSTAGTAPAKMSISRTSSINDSTGILTRFYTLTFVTDVSSVEVAEE